MPAQVEELIKRRKDLWNKASTARDLWQELAEYGNIQRANITVEREPGERQSDKLFDSQAIKSSLLLAATLGSTLTSPAQKWFSLLMRQQELNEQKGIRDWLEEVADRTYLAQGQSNFMDEMGEAYLDLVVFGTACIFQDEAPMKAPNTFGGFRFTAIPIGRYALAEGPDGRVHTVFRQIRMSQGALLEQFPKVEGELRQRAENRPDDTIDVWHACYPRKGAKDYKRQAPATEQRWASCYFVETPGTLLEEGGFHEFPFAVPRWSKVAGEEYGRGPLHAALPDIRSLNHAVKVWLEAMVLAMRPPLVELNNAVVGSLSLEPAARNVEKEKDAIRALDVTGKFQVAIEAFERLERKIDELLFVPQLRLKETPAMTATEVQERREETLRLLGPTAGRLHSELLAPTVERGVAIELRANALPPAPQELLEAPTADIDIAYEGPLARAQKTLDLIAIERKNAWVIQNVATRPEILDLYDWDAEGRHVATVAGVPGNLVRGEDEVAEIRNRRAQAQAKQAQMQALAGVAEAAGKAAPMAKVISESAGSPAGVAA